MKITQQLAEDLGACAVFYGMLVKNPDYALHDWCVQYTKSISKRKNDISKLEFRIQELRNFITEVSKLSHPDGDHWISYAERKIEYLASTLRSEQEVLSQISDKFAPSKFAAWYDDLKRNYYSGTQISILELVGSLEPGASPVP